MPKISKSKIPYSTEDRDGARIELDHDKGDQFLLSFVSGTNIMGESIWECVYVTSKQLEEMLAYAKSHAWQKLNKALKANENLWKIYQGKNGYGRCPFCKENADADEVDNGVGMQQCGPAFCPACFAYVKDDGAWHPGPQWAPMAELEKALKHLRAIQAELTEEQLKGWRIKQIQMEKEARGR